MFVPPKQTHIFQPADQYIITNLRKKLNNAWHDAQQAMLLKVFRSTAEEQHEALRKAALREWSTSMQARRRDKMLYLTAALETLDAPSVIKSWAATGILRALPQLRCANQADRARFKEIRKSTVVIYDLYKKQHEELRRIGVDAVPGGLQDPAIGAADTVVEHAAVMEEVHAGVLDAMAARRIESDRRASELHMHEQKATQQAAAAKKPTGKSSAKPASNPAAKPVSKPAAVLATPRASSVSTFFAGSRGGSASAALFQSQAVDIDDPSYVPFQETFNQPTRQLQRAPKSDDDAAEWERFEARLRGGATRHSQAPSKPVDYNNNHDDSESFFVGGLLFSTGRQSQAPQMSQSAQFATPQPPAQQLRSTQPPVHAATTATTVTSSVVAVSANATVAAAPARPSAPPPQQRLNGHGHRPHVPGADVLQAAALAQQETPAQQTQQEQQEKRGPGRPSNRDKLNGAGCQKLDRWFVPKPKSDDSAAPPPPDSQAAWAAQRRERPDGDEVLPPAPQNGAQQQPAGHSGAGAFFGQSVSPAAAAASTFGEDYWAECDAEDALHREREDEDRQREERRRAGR